MTGPLAAERVELDQLGYPSVYGRIRGGETLVEAGVALFMLNDFPELRMVPGEFAEVDEEWTGLIESIEPPALAAHLGMFFQEPQSARCCGAALTGKDKGTFIEVDGVPHQEIVVSWWIGEGQGDCYLARVLDDAVPPVPEFQGCELLTRAAEEERPEKSRRVSSSDEVLSIPLRTHLEGVEHKDYQAFITAVGDHDIDAFIAGMSVAQSNLWKLLIPLGGLDREGNAHAALAVLHAGRTHMVESERVRTALRWAERLYDLGCLDEAVEAFARCEEIGDLCTEYMIPNMGAVLARYARAAYDNGQFQLALDKANAALAEEEGLGAAVAVKGCALFALGEAHEAFELIEQVMQIGMDPLPNQALAESGRYRELALAHSIAVPVWD